MMERGFKNQFYILINKIIKKINLIPPKINDQITLTLSGTWYFSRFE